jgi:hypothetical protein
LVVQLKAVAAAVRALWAGQRSMVQVKAVMAALERRRQFPVHRSLMPAVAAVVGTLPGVRRAHRPAARVVAAMATIFLMALLAQPTLAVAAVVVVTTPPAQYRMQAALAAPASSLHAISGTSAQLVVQ